jgi:hypothetical protein
LLCSLAGYLSVWRAELVLFCFCSVEAAIYLAQFSKESIVVLIILALVAIPRGATGDVLFVALARGYACLIRNYWFLVAALYLAFRLLLHARKPSSLPIFVVIAMLCLTVGSDLIFGLNLNSAREVVAQTNSLYANTVIQDYKPVTGPLGGAANALCTLVLLVIPLPLLATSEPVYLAFSGLITVLWLNLFFVVRKGMRKSWFGSYSADASAGGSHAPVVKIMRRASSLSSPHSVAVSR